jgi:hypothetical protein
MDTEKIINALNDELDRLTKAISEARKQGKDAKMAEIMIIGVGQKIKYAEVSEDPKDINRARLLLARTKQELDQAVER